MKKWNCGNCRFAIYSPLQIQTFAIEWFNCCRLHLLNINIISTSDLTMYYFYCWFVMQIPIILFCLVTVIPNCPLVCFLFFLTVGPTDLRSGYSRSQNSNISSIQWEGDNTYKFVLFPKRLLPFPTFPGGMENTYSQFLRNLFTNSRIVCRFWSRYSSINGCRMIGGCHTT